PMAAVLELPAAEPRTIRGYGTLTIWPYLIDTDFDALTERERADLKALGYSAAHIDLMSEGGFGYQGPRLAIDETGLWRSFTTMGEGAGSGEPDSAAQELQDRAPLADLLVDEVGAVALRVRVELDVAT